jgi:6-phosphogluconate dehydrogenase
MMIGGETEIVEHLDPIFTRLAPGNASASRPLGRESIDTTAEQGYLRCGPSGAGHFVKMVNNGIEYGAMAAYAEGLAILRSANVGLKQNLADAETLPYEILSNYQYDFDLRDIAEVWRRGSVISSWLLDLTAEALAKDSNLPQFAGRVSDSGEGRWTIKAAIDEGFQFRSFRVQCMRVSHHEASPSSKIRCYLRCAMVSGAIWRRVLSRDDTRGPRIALAVI